jgi:hypothetical protein
MGRRRRGESDMQTRNGNLIIADLVGSTRHTRHLETTKGNTGPRMRLGGNNQGTQEDVETAHSRFCGIFRNLSNVQLERHSVHTLVPCIVHSNLCYRK